MAKQTRVEKELARLKAKHGRCFGKVLAIPDYRRPQLYPSAGDGFAPGTFGKRDRPIDHGLLVGTLHKQGPMVLSKADLPFAGGRKV